MPHAHAPDGSPGGLALIYTTLPDLETAERFGATLIDQRLVACVNLFPGVVALYEYDGKRERASEVAAILKTTAARLEAALAAAKEAHPYEVPALIVLDPAHTDPKFLSWADAQVAPARPLDTARKGQ